MGMLKIAATLLAALLLCPSAFAATLYVDKGPAKRPLFTELYRQAVIVAARYGRGLDVIDGSLTPGPAGTLVVSLSDQGDVLRIVLHQDGRQLAFGHAPYPGVRWDALADIEKSRKFAAAFVGRIPGNTPETAKVGVDLPRAHLGFQMMNLAALTWTVNTLGAAQRGRVGDVEALKLMSACYGWLGHWLNAFPSPRAKIFHARALALASFAGGVGGGEVPELALALAHVGRQADALFVIARSTPTNVENERIAAALAREDSARAAQEATSSRQWLWTLMYTSMYNELEDVHESVLRELTKDPTDVAALHFRILSGDAQRVELIGALTDLPGVLADEFLAGSRPEPKATVSGAAPPDWKRLIDAASDSAAGDAVDEIPRAARATLLLDVAVDAAALGAPLVGGGEGAARFGAQAALLAAAHPWGFLPRMMTREAQGAENYEETLTAALTQAPICYGGLVALHRGVHDEHEWDLYKWLTPRESEIDDISLDTLYRAFIDNAPVNLGRIAELDPFSDSPYERGGEQVVDLGLERLGDRPALLKRKLRFHLAKRPLNDAATMSLVERLLAVDPADWRARWTLAALRMRAGKHEEAAMVWRELIAREPVSEKGARAAAEMSWIYAVAGDPSRARRLALAAAPAYTREGLLALAHAFEDAGRYDLAERVYTMAEFRFARHRGGTLIAKFFMRTGDPRGYGLARSSIPRFFAGQGRSGELTEDDHQELLEAFLLTGEWVNAYELLNKVIIPRWRTNDARHFLWLVTCWLEAEQSRSEAVKILERNRGGVPKDDPFAPFMDAFAQTRTPDEAFAELDLDPRLRSAQLYFMAVLFTSLRPNPARADNALRAVVALKQYDSVEYYLALKRLGLVPSYPARLRRQFSAAASDLMSGWRRLSRWWRVRSQGKAP